jgi:hypothetical protein
MEFILKIPSSKRSEIPTFVITSTHPAFSMKKIRKSYISLGVAILYIVKPN